ncbi:ArnT family glycosyltransferase [Helicovermis profundi]|uniref:Glycosyltransferase RgtA/B/C/D-like domain-containing protein n=1 Tax=Helicovermis profundi TaxID=3065157 RepID=A0AAU9E7A4_9FIRM|nr:hypothetical protein HLPR_08530 [Clostridia bacterium S502]
MLSNLIKQKNIVFLILIFFIVNIIFLTSFPFIHSDEPWLSGLSREISIEKTFNTTETFFDLYPRHPNSLKSVFIIIQIIFLKVFGYSIFTFRLISLIFSSLSLFFFYKLLKITYSELSSLIGSSLLALNIQFIYSSHFARQEALILFIFILSLYLIDNKKYTTLNLAISISFWIHPNSYIIALIIFSILFYKNAYKELKSFVLFCSLSTLLLIATNFMLNINFIKNYIDYGSTLGVTSNINSRFLNFISFFKKLYLEISGTYYVPNIKIYYYICLVSTSLAVFIKESRKYLLSILMLLLGIFIVGRNNATSIIFIFPLIILLFMEILDNIFNKKRIKILLLSLFLILTIANTTINIFNAPINDYSTYISNINSYVSKNSKVLCNLNAEYAFNNGNLFDFRNLVYLKENNISLSEYIKKNKIEYIILSNEIEYINNNRQWNIVYGDVSSYYDELDTFIKTNCSLEGSFISNDYGIRIVRYINEGIWNINIYKVKNSY